MNGVTLEQANAIVTAALAEGRRLNLMPLSVAVLDAGGHLVAFQREDRSGIMRAEVAMGKAWGALGMGISPRLLRDRLADRPSFQAALAVASGGRFIPVPGGVLIRAEDKSAIGAVGISGDTSDKDEACAIAGIKAAGLRPDPREAAEGWEYSRL